MAEVTDPIVLDSTGQDIATAITNIYISKRKQGLKFVSWANSTDEEIVDAIDKAYNGGVDLENDFGWAVGDTRIVKLNAMAAQSDVMYDQPEQYVKMVLIDKDHYDLADGSGNKCKFVVGFGNCLYAQARMNTSASYTTGWGGATLHNVLNGAFRTTMIPESLRPIFKQFMVFYGTPTYSSMWDYEYFTLPSEKEIFGSYRYEYQYEANNETQLAYYATVANRNKDNVITPSGSTQTYLLRNNYRNTTTVSGAFNGATSLYDLPSVAADVYSYISPMGVI